MSPDWSMQSAFLGAFQLDPDHERPQVKSELDKLLTLLPSSPDAWMVVREATDSRLLVLAGAALFTLRRHEGQFVMSSVLCRVLRVEHQRDDEKRSWTFLLRDDDEPIEVVARVGQSGEREADNFAAILAGRVGWIVPAATDRAPVR